VRVTVYVLDGAAVAVPTSVSPHSATSATTSKIRRRMRVPRIVECSPGEEVAFNVDISV
jgi:hypothetical protein